jgi:two-component system chemotaxis response regulator CheB
MIVVGGSLGGLRALTVMLRGIPTDFAIPFAVVLHRHKDSDGMLLEMLQRDSPTRNRSCLATFTWPRPTTI